jgi:hypothetical protein
MKKVGFSCCVVLLMLLAGIPAQALEPLALYDNFKGKVIDPDKWVRGEFPGAGTDAVQEIKGNRLHMEYRAYGRTDSDTGLLTSALFLATTTPAAITAMAATVRVHKLEATGCPTNPDFTRQRVGIQGAFFNTGTSTPDSAVNDVRALIALRHHSTDPPDELTAVSLVLQCTEALCLTFSVIDSDTLGVVRRQEEARLQVQWDPDNDQFLFQLDDEPIVVSSYAPHSDAAEPGLPFKILEATHLVANCTTQPRPVGFWDVFFDDVFVNASAAP